MKTNVLLSLKVFFCVQQLYILLSYPASILWEEPLMIWGGSGKNGEKTQQPGRRKKLNSTTSKKKIHHGLYAGLRCPEHGDTWLLHTIYVQITNYFEEVA